MAVWNPEANDLFLEALDLPGPDDRRAFLDRACRSGVLRTEVEALLTASSRAGRFLEVPAAEQLGLAVPNPESAVITFDCPACKRKLKVKPELGGKKGKCPVCGQAVLFPVGAGVPTPVLPGGTPELPSSASGTNHPTSAPALEQTMAAGGSGTQDGSLAPAAPPAAAGGDTSDLTSFLAP